MKPKARVLIDGHEVGVPEVEVEHEGEAVVVRFALGRRVVRLILTRTAARHLAKWLSRESH